MRGAVVALLCLVATTASAITVPDDFTTIQAALNAAVPGDTIRVKDTSGPYHEKISFPASGTSGAPIVLEAFPGHSPILDGAGVSGSNMVLIDSKSWVTLRGFEIRNNTGVNDGSGVRVLGSGTHVEIRDNRIHDIRGNDAMGITVYGTEPTSISNLIIDNNQVYDSEPARSEAITLNGNVELFEVTNNVVRDVNNIGIDFIGGETDIQPDTTKVARNGVCRGNRVSRARSIYEGGFAGGIYVDGGRDIVIERNVVTESDLGLEVGAENNGITTTNITVRDNVIYNNDKVCIVFGGFAANVGRVKNSTFEHNTCWQNDTLGIGFGELWIQYAEDNVVRHNIFSATVQNLLTYSESGNVDNALDWNLWFSPGTPRFVWQSTEYSGFAAYAAASSQDSHSLNADPQLLSPETADFHLSSTSPAVDAGDAAFVAGVGETDIDGAPRVNGARVDIGADELGCGNGTTDPGELCDDGNVTDCDGCDSNCTPTSTCGNRVVCGAEQCDDGNTAAGDCCSATCQFEAASSACDDGDLCTRLDQCDGAGDCAGSATPEPMCRAAQPTKSLLLLRDRTPDTRDLLLWRWSRGEQTLLGDFGSPTSSTGYTLCVYDQSVLPQPVLRARVPGGGFCPGGACWKVAGPGYRYKNRNGAASGILRVSLRSGGDGQSSALVRGKGMHLPMPALGLSAPVTVQLRNDLGGCWGASYSSPLANQPDQFRARSD